MLGFSKSGKYNWFRYLTAACLSLLFVLTTQAYTLVTRDGRRTAIPDNFTLTQVALTYEAAPQLNVTVLLANVDIAATERANGEAAGSFLRRLRATAPRSAETPGENLLNVRKTLTNQDLEVYRRQRVAQEQAANRRRAASGLPSLEEESARLAAEAATRQKAQAATQLSDNSTSVDDEEAQAEKYWRERAARWRAEAAEIEAQINYVRARVAETEDVSSNTTSIYGFSTPLYGFAIPSYGQPNLSLSQVRPGLPYNWGPGFNNLAPGTQVNPAVDLSANARAFQRAVRPAPYYRYQYGGYIVTGRADAYSYETERLRARLDELYTTRAALNARWQVLSEEARRAGALPGWLRP